jgi:hypothetical protein
MSETVIERMLYVFDFAGEPMLVYDDGDVYCRGVGPTVYLSKRNSTGSRGSVYKHFSCSATARPLRGQVFKGFGLAVHVLDWRRSKQPFLITNVKLR